VSKVRSYAWLAWRAVVPHPLRALRRTGTGEERFLAAYGAEGLAPTTLETLADAEAASACISCGLCDSACSLRAAIPAVRSLGLHAAFRLCGKSDEMLALSGGVLAACATCTGCEPLCPTGVPITRLVRAFAARAAGLDAARRANGPAAR
jgi:succinate dehydrogenase/fumarate reductase-like Fe-S protein